MSEEESFARKEIEALRIGYTAHYDAQDMNALIDLFADDAVCHFPEHFGGNWIGKDAIRANFTTWMAAVGSPFDAVHVVTNETIVLDGPDRAEGGWYLTDILTRQAPAAADGDHRRGPWLPGGRSAAPEGVVGGVRVVIDLTSIDAAAPPFGDVPGWDFTRGCRDHDDDSYRRKREG